MRARHDPAWTADGYVSDRWRPVSPVTGRLDAFQWQTPVASLPSDRGRTIESSPFEEAMLASAPHRELPPAPAAQEKSHETTAAAIRETSQKTAQETAKATIQEASQDAVEDTAQKTAPEAVQDNSPQAGRAAEAAAPPADPSPAPAPQPELAGQSAAPLFRSRADLAKPAAPVPPVIPIVRPPDDPGVDDEARTDEFSEQIGQPKAQAGGWRGFWSRLGG